MIEQCDRCRKYYDGRSWVDPGLFEPKTNESHSTLCPICRELPATEATPVNGLGRLSAAEPEQIESRGMHG